MKNKAQRSPATTQAAFMKEMKENQNELLAKLRREKLDADQNLLQSMEKLMTTQTSMLLQGLHSWHNPAPLVQQNPNLESYIAPIVSSPSQTATLFPMNYNPSFASSSQFLPPTTQSMYDRQSVSSSELAPRATSISHSIKNGVDTILDSRTTNDRQLSQEHNVLISTLAKSSGNGLYSDNERDQMKKRKMGREASVDSSMDQSSVATSNKMYPTVENMQLVHEAHVKEEMNVAAGIEIEIPEDMILNETFNLGEFIVFHAP